MDIRFNIVAVLYSVVALLGLPRLLREWRELLAPELSLEARGLAVYVALFLGVPLATLGHELGHLLTAKALGAAEATLHYRVFWGFVEHTSLAGRGNWWVALAGNAVSWATAVVSLLLARAPLPPGLRYTALLFGVFELIHVLVAYPLVSLGGLPGADWTVIYGRPFWVGTWAVAAVHAASLLWLRREVHALARLAPPTEAGGSHETSPEG